MACKWSLSVLAGIRRGVCRPGALQRAIEGISTKVLNQRLAKMVRFGLLSKHNFGEVPPRVEYRLTGFGERLVAILDQVEELQKDLDRLGATGKRSVDHRSKRPAETAKS